MTRDDPRDTRGRGATTNPPNRFDRLHLAVEPTWAEDDTARRLVATEYFRDTSRSIISRNDSPDIPFEVSLNDSSRGPPTLAPALLATRWCGCHWP